MWQLDNQTRYAAERTWIRDADGAEVWIVAVKATYALQPDGRAQIAEQQKPIHPGLVLHEDGLSPAFETDLGPSKAATDVWLCGHAWSQNGKPVPHLRVGFQVGPIQRQLEVFGERYWKPGFLRDAASAPRPFVRMPLTWAHAYGGDGPDGISGNPVGMGLTKDADGRQRLPHLEHPARPLRGPQDEAPSMGVGPVPRHWPPRSRYAGTYDTPWQAARAPLPASSLDPRHWQVSPPEQQVPGHLKGGEPIVLDGLTPPGFAKNGLYRSAVPKLSLGFTTHFLDGSRVVSRSVIHNLILLPDLPALCVVHHMALPCHAQVNLLERTTIIEKRRPLDRVERLLP